jgi:hypothetical protein
MEDKEVKNEVLEEEIEIDWGNKKKRKIRRRKSRIRQKRGCSK